MAATAKVITIGNSAGVILPKEMLSRLKVEKGDTLYVSEVPGGLQLSPHDEQLAATMEAADRVIRRYRDTLKKLAE
jgi:putative addiction module antidote